MVIMAFLAYLSISAMIYAILIPLPFLKSVSNLQGDYGMGSFAEF